MSIEGSGHLVLGITRQGKKFRPSDWSERIASVFGRFDSRQCFRYNPMVRPVMHEGIRSLFVDNELFSCQPEGFNFVMQFASRNQLQVVTYGEPDSHTPNDDLQHVA